MIPPEPINSDQTDSPRSNEGCEAAGNGVPALPGSESSPLRPFAGNSIQDSAAGMVSEQTFVTGDGLPPAIVSSGREMSERTLGLVNPSGLPAGVVSHETPAAPDLPRSNEVREGFSIPPSDHAEFMALPEESRRQVKSRLKLMEIIAAAKNKRRACRFHAARMQGVYGFSAQRLYTLFFAYRRSNDWRALLNYAKAGITRSGSPCNAALPRAFREFWKLLCEENKRRGGDKAAHRMLLAIWRSGFHPTSKKQLGEIPGYVQWPSADPLTGIPKGWTYSNLSRHSPNAFEKTVARIGRSAAAAHRPLVYGTRADLWVGSHYLFDDLWHDHFVNCLDTKKTGRPLEFGAFDLFSACKFAWGMRVRTENDATGKMEGLKEEMMRFLLASVLAQHGYSPRGTILVVEHGTAAIREDLERVLYDCSGGKITVARSGMDGGGDALGIYAGRSKGNFRFKAAYESLHNLVHNEMGALPGQTGPNRETRPEALHGLLKRNDALLCAMAALEQEAPERAKMLRFDLLEFRWFLDLAMDIYQRMNGRVEHDLEGWGKQIVQIQRGDRWYFRRKSPTEVWDGGRKELTRLDPLAIAMILGPDIGIARTIHNGVTEIQDKEFSVDPLMFDTHCVDRGEYQVVLNPFLPDRLFVFNTKGGFVAECPRIWRVSRLDAEGLQRAYGRARKIEGEMLAPVRARGAKLLAEQTENARHNAAVLAGNAIGKAPISTRKIAADAFESLPEPGQRGEEATPAEDQEALLDNI